MDISAVANYSRQLSQARVADAAQLMVLKKAMNVQSESALTLLDSVKSSATNLPAHLGQHVNVVA